MGDCVVVVRFVAWRLRMLRPASADAFATEVSGIATGDRAMLPLPSTRSN